MSDGVTDANATRTATTVESFSYATPITDPRWWDVDALATLWATPGARTETWLDDSDPRLIPSLTMDGLRAYAMDGQPTGDFLRSMLTNDLAGAVGRADRDNLKAIRAIMLLIHNHPAIGSHHGTAANYWHHIAMKALEHKP